jgi:hypothetical protein
MTWSAYPTHNVKDLMETILFAPVRFHDTVSKGRLLNRFGKDFEGMTSPS